MVSNVRFKVLMRLRAYLDDLVTEYESDFLTRELIDMARQKRDLAEWLKLAYRNRLETVFPGCQIRCTNTRVYLTLPDSYPAAGVPISAGYDFRLIPALFGVPAPPDF